jgi:hypothetical protein
MPSDEIKNIFLSCTVKDCIHYRLQMKEALEYVPVTVHLQEDWTNAASYVTDVCRQKLKDQDGYMGLFGYRYGWIPPDQSFSAKSITHLEWEWAKQHWTSRQPPIFIFLPNPGSEAEQELQRRAKEVLEQEYPNCPSEQQTSLQRQESFRQEVRDWANATGRCINSYGTALELMQKGSSCIHHWNRSILKQACEVYRGELRKRIPAAELGAIGRYQQVKQLEQILVQLRQRQREVAAAFVIHGEENHGQRHFAHFLHEWAEWNEEDEILGLFQPDRPEDAAHLARWACNQLGLGQEVALAEAMERLVAALAFRLRERNVVILLQSLGNGPDRWQRFAEDFWSPLRQRLAQAVSGKTRGRLHWFVVANEPFPFAPAALDWDSASPIPLPQLQPLREQDVSDWLRHRNPKLNGVSIRSGLRAEISKAVTHKDGKPDGVPLSVFERLQNKGMWEF